MPTTPSQSFLERFKSWMLGRGTRFSMNPIERQIQHDFEVAKFARHCNLKASRMSHALKVKARNRALTRVQRRSRQINRRHKR